MTHPFDKVLKSRFGGVLKHGSHNPDGEACALEAASVARGNGWDDAPGAAGLPDIRPLNDGPWSSDEGRTRAMVPLVKALWTWPRWGETRRREWRRRAVLRFNREILRHTQLEADARIDVAVDVLRWAARGEGTTGWNQWSQAEADRHLSLACKIMREEARR